MSKINIIKILGLVGAVLTAAATALNGDFVTAAGIISASLASSNITSK